MSDVCKKVWRKHLAKLCTKGNPRRWCGTEVETKRISRTIRGRTDGDM